MQLWNQDLIVLGINTSKNLFKFQERNFGEEISEKVFRECYRVPRQVLDELEVLLNEQLRPKHVSKENLSTRDKLKVFLSFLGTNSFYHCLRDIHGVGTDTVFRYV